jgi:superfamily II helicase
LTCIYNHDTELEAICEKVELGSAHVEELIDKLCEWELIEEMSPSLQVSERGKNVLSYYHNYAAFLQVRPMVAASVPDY